MVMGRRQQLVDGGGELPRTARRRQRGVTELMRPIRLFGARRQHECPVTQVRILREDPEERDVTPFVREMEGEEEKMGDFVQYGIDRLTHAHRRRYGPSRTIEQRNDPWDPLMLRDDEHVPHFRVRIRTRVGPIRGIRGVRHDDNSDT